MQRSGRAFSAFSARHGSLMMHLILYVAIAMLGNVLFVPVGALQRFVCRHATSILRFVFTVKPIVLGFAWEMKTDKQRCRLAAEGSAARYFLKQNWAGSEQVAPLNSA